MLGIDPGPWTLGGLIDAYTARQRENWEHTCALVASWTGKTVRNPYRRATRRALMRPAELYAIQAAIEERNKHR